MVDVVDGDTIKIEVDEKLYTIRYIGIDCPETRHPVVGGQTVYLEKDVSETDRYGRLLRYVFLADGTFVNAELVRLGYAQVSTDPPDVRYQSLFLEAQREAREAERGLWGPTPEPGMTPSPMPPLHRRRLQQHNPLLPFAIVRATSTTAPISRPTPRLNLATNTVYRWVLVTSTA